MPSSMLSISQSSSCQLQYTLVSMSGDLIAVIVGLLLGFAIVGLVLWRHRAEVKRSWQMRFGSATETPTATSEPSDGRVVGLFSLSPWKRRLVIGTSLLVSLGNAALAATATDGELLHQFLRVFSAVIFATIAGLVMLKGRPQRG
jgi:hypothetical protein